MLSVSQWLALPHLPPSKRCSSSNIQKQLSNKTDQDKEKTEKKERKKKRVSSRKDCSVGNGGAKSMISPRRRLEGIDEKESDRVRGRKRERKEREKERKGKRKRKGSGSQHTSTLLQAMFVLEHLGQV